MFRETQKDHAYLTCSPDRSGRDPACRLSLDAVREFKRARYQRSFELREEFSQIDLIRDPLEHRGDQIARGLPFDARRGQKEIIRFESS